MIKILYAELQKAILNYAIENGIVSETDTLNEIMNKSKTALLQLHKRNIYQREDGRWVTKLGDKKPYTRIVRVNKEDLEDIIFQYYLTESNQNITFEDCLMEWLDYEEHAVNPSICPKSVSNYRSEYNRFIKGHSFSNQKMQDITMSIVRSLLIDIINRSEKCSRKRFNSIKSLITRVFDYARMDLELEVIHIRQIMKELVFKPNQFLVTAPTQQVFYQDDMQLLMNYLFQENTLISLGIALTAQTGLRISETAALSWDNVTNHTLHICRAEHSWTASDGTRHIEIGLPKEYKVRDVILSNEANFIISKIKMIHPTNTGFIFLNNGNRATCRMFDYYIRKYCNKCNIPVLSMHKLRKTYASVLLANGYADKVVQSQLGHSDINTTQQHYNYNPYLLEEQVTLFSKANIMLSSVTPLS